MGRWHLCLCQPGRFGGIPAPRSSMPIVWPCQKKMTQFLRFESVLPDAWISESLSEFFSVYLESELTQICPEEPYPKCFSFFPPGRRALVLMRLQTSETRCLRPHTADAVSLFEALVQFWPGNCVQLPLHRTDIWIVSAGCNRVHLLKKKPGRSSGLAVVIAPGRIVEVENILISQ